MSYILDALNKSERERERNQSPGLKSLRGEGTPGRFQLRHFLYLAAFLVLFNSIGVYLFFGDKFAGEKLHSNETTREPGAGSTETINTEVINTEAIYAEITSPSHAANNFEDADPPAAFFSPLAAVPASTGLSPAVSISELPTHVRNRIPELQITAHIYASDPDLRMVNINGVARHEGDLISNSLQLVEITDLGVIMNFEGYAYVMDIVEDWQNNL